MTTEMFIENYQLDISTELSSLITFELDNIRKFADRSTSWSKTIILPGTSNNNKLFGHIFQIGQSNDFNDLLDNVGYNFNASKSADCIVFQDQLQTFKGVLRLMQINIYKGKIEYEVAVFGQIAGLNVSLSSGLLENLDFSAYDHTYNETNIVNSWDAAPGSGYYYPLLDYGKTSTNKHDWDIRTFRPALYVKEYIDKMFAAAGFRYSSALFQTERFKKLVVPHNQKTIAAQGSRYVDVDSTGQFISSPLTTKINFPTTIQINGFTPSDANQHTFNYDDPATINPVLTLHLTGVSTSNTTSLLIAIYRVRGGGAQEVLTSVYLSPGTAVPFDKTISVSAELQQNDDIYCRVTGITAGNGATCTIQTGKFTVEPVSGAVVEISYGDTVSINGTIPKNVRQVDFLVSIIKLFNLYVYEDRFDTRLIYITPFVDFYNTSSIDSVDWTYKLNRDKAIKVKPMSEINAKKYEFKYRPDSDYYNDLYKKRYGQGYGDYTFDSQYEFAEQTNSLELVFSATPLVGYSGEEKVYPTIFKQSNNVEEKTDSNIRILQTKKVTGVSSWDILDGVSVLTSTTDYGYAGHLDDPDVPSNDLNFGALRELFFTVAGGNLSATQFNLYWSSYMAEITDKDSKLMSGWFLLTPKDILELDFSKKIYVDGVLFRLNSIKDYNVTRPEDCPVELLKIGYLIY